MGVFVTETKAELTRINSGILLRDTVKQIMICMGKVQSSLFTSTKAKPIALMSALYDTNHFKIKNHSSLSVREKKIH